MFEAPRMSPDTIQMLQTNRGTPVQPVQQGISMNQMQAMINSLRNRQAAPTTDMYGQPLDHYAQEGGGGG